ncbi:MULTISPECIES: TIGR04219 family outer membrane beta-barrel protein [Alteromonadaceae]|jgi:outer membrane protein|uniref:TIGR04219 family outer membrane beta-barrel protein n=1 Tax=Brumicola blandensis TaxID=3075611 RepID=A0AAW8R4T5_9ALTE|nr:MULTISPECIES: TIGR04219 family outer membrane beta-barrel protein [unclassified Alteromonas]MDT0584222.1 TIGR04219 family outer membrane beta-barrel protein [Alteromonas sp. W409]MDT0629671.1 TIGR04219 family outer membrane beta-barrel protein [Alteromonas sp. W364]
MRKSLLGCAMLAAVATAPAQADTLLGAYVGAQGWNMGVEGGFANEESLTEFSYDDQTNSSLYVALEHPVPLIPNLKLVRTTMDTSGFTNLNSQFEFNGELYSANTDVSTDFEMSATDIILYYEILDNDLVSVDIGLNGKYLDGTIVVSESESNRTATEEFSGVIPMAYAKAEVGLPFTGLGVYAEGSFLAIGDHSVSDIQAALTYSFVESLALDMTLQAGYRAVTVELDDIDDFYADLEFSGVFVGLEFDF